jgi:outer membrane protein, multidrug efflux system
MGTTGCGLIHSVDHNVAAPVEVPGAFGRAPTGPVATASVARGHWWTSFEDAELDRLVETALSQNLGLRQAFMRLRQAMAISGQAKALRFPEITVNGGVSRGRNNFFAGGDIISFEATRYNAGVGATYEVDIWGRIHSEINATEFEIGASRQDFEAMAMTLTAQVADAWFGLVTQRRARNLLREQFESNKTYLDLVRFRFAQGLASALDVYQQEVQLRATEALVPLVDQNAAVLEHQLAVLVGRAPGAFPIAETESRTWDLPNLPAVPDFGVPLYLLTRRPDVRAAHMRVVAADYRIGAAIADRLPAIRLTGSTGFSSVGGSNFFENWIWNLAAGISGPLFDGGRRAAEQDRTELVLEERLAAYGQTVLQAVQEVEDALVRESTQLEHVQKLRAQLDAAKNNLREARTRYMNGLNDYLPVLAALNSVQRVEQEELLARRQLFAFRIQLCRAIGGHWTRDLEEPPGPKKPASTEAS